MKNKGKIARTLMMLILFLQPGLIIAGGYSIDHMDPPIWWTGMHNPQLTLMVHGKDISDLDPQISYPGVAIQTVTRTPNPNYLFITLNIGEQTDPGVMKIVFNKNGKEQLTHPYELKHRKEGSAERESFGPEDVVYLLMPDRFANGDPANDSAGELKEKANRNDPGGRHGGDIQGIIDHLDYLKDLGITAIWTTPLLEDNMDTYSYHTYATTDYYKVDARYGTNEDYARLAAECHKRGIKLIMDMVPNHCGSNHWWMDDLPMPGACIS
jgi:hypothetical protein